MQYSKCKCGKAERWCSGYPIHPCEGCEDCGTTLSFGPNGHKPLQSHKWQEIKEVRVIDGVEKVERHYWNCSVCDYHKPFEDGVKP